MPKAAKSKTKPTKYVAELTIETREKVTKKMVREVLQWALADLVQKPSITFVTGFRVRSVDID